MGLSPFLSQMWFMGVVSSFNTPIYPLPQHTKPVIYTTLDHYIKNTNLTVFTAILTCT